MKLKLPSIRIPFRLVWIAGLVLAVGVGFVTLDRWWPHTQAWVQTTISAQKKAPLLDGHDHGSGGDDHAGHDHGDHGHAHDNASSLKLSKQAMGNIGLTAEFLKPVELETFRRAIMVPAIVVERPGRTRIEVSTPMAGVITHVHAVRGEAIKPGSLLFEIRITAEELVATQTELLKTIGELDVENREIARLEAVTKSGAVPQKTLLERQYAKDKLEVLLAAQKEALRLQGLSERQIGEIVEKRRLLRDLQIVAPAPDEHSHEELRLTRKDVIPISHSETGDSPPPGERPPHADKVHAPLILQEVRVHKGETVPAGATLAIVADMSELYIEGRAFEQDIDLLAAAAARGWRVTALFERAGQQVEDVADLELLYSASDVDVESRTLRFYVRLPNRIVREVPSPNGLSYVEWKYRPGQRLQLRVPVEEWERQIVLPVDAIAQEGAESYVFQQNGDHFDRVPVRVIYRDQSHAVVKNDGSIFPGDIIARRGAHQMQMALKNKSGGGVDPHAGHNH
ncbi:MAG: hemolysin D [Planctomycetaceae bacterium]|nr:MAG: hemolysin D [Planctomycetaceae bacterium]